MTQFIFKRYEKKYILNREQFEQIKKSISENTSPDRYGISEICNIYYDTPNFTIIRKSLQKPVYKEKLRLRCYGIPKNSSKCFLEIKKKYKGVVYKRRISTDYTVGLNFLNGNSDDIPPSQIKDEILYFKNFYEGLKPAMAIFYKRQAFYEKGNRNVRFTFDQDLRYRTYDLDLSLGSYGKEIIPKEQVIMEIKTAGAIPLWAVEILNQAKVFPTSFSKYGTAYKNEYL